MGDKDRRLAELQRWQDEAARLRRDVATCECTLEELRREKISLGEALRGSEAQGKRQAELIDQLSAQVSARAHDCIEHNAHLLAWINGRDCGDVGESETCA